MYLSNLNEAMKDKKNWNCKTKTTRKLGENVTGKTNVSMRIKSNDDIRRWRQF